MHTAHNQKHGKFTEETTVNEIKTTPYDVAEHLRTTEEIALYLEACAVEASCDAVFMARAREDAARAVNLNAQSASRNQ